VSRKNSIATDNPWFAENLFRQMKRQGVSTRQLAEWLNISYQSIYQWREGKWPTDENFEALCVCLQCQPDDLLTKARDRTEMLLLSAWAKREKIPTARARDLFDLRILNGETRTKKSILVPPHLKAPEDSKQLVLMAKVRPRWVPNFQENFPRLLKGANGRSMVAVGAAVGVKPSAVFHWAKRKNYPKEERLPKIAEALGVTMQDLVGDIRL